MWWDHRGERRGECQLLARPVSPDLPCYPDIKHAALLPLPGPPDGPPPAAPLGPAGLLASLLRPLPCLGSPGSGRGQPVLGPHCGGGWRHRGNTQVRTGCLSGVWKGWRSFSFFQSFQQSLHQVSDERPTFPPTPPTLPEETRLSQLQPAEKQSQDHHKTTIRWRLHEVFSSWLSSLVNLFFIKTFSYLNVLNICDKLSL